MQLIGREISKTVVWINVCVIKVTLAAGWAKDGRDAWRRPIETTLVALGRVAWDDEVALRWRDREALETCFSTWVPGIDGLDMGWGERWDLVKKSQLAEDSWTLTRICPPRFLNPGFIYVFIFTLTSTTCFWWCNWDYNFIPLNSGSLHKQSRNNLPLPHWFMRPPFSIRNWSYFSNTLLYNLSPFAFITQFSWLYVLIH